MNDSYKHPKWQKKRLEILNRDGWKCCACGTSDSTLHVHHAFYDGDLWSVHEKWLQTLCEQCHKKLGPHPKGGVWWSHDDLASAVCVAWCAICGCQSFKDKGSYFKCESCSWRTDIYESVNMVSASVAKERLLAELVDQRIRREAEETAWRPFEGLLTADTIQTFSLEQLELIGRRIQEFGWPTWISWELEALFLERLVGERRKRRGKETANVM